MKYYARLAFVNTFALYRLGICGFVVLYWYRGEWNQAIGLLMSGVFSDYVDGFLARRWQVTTKFGFWFEMLSDRYLLMSPFLAEVLRGTFSWYLLPFIVVLIIMTDIMAIGSKRIQAPQVVYWFALYVAIYLLILRETSFDYTLKWMIIFVVISLIPISGKEKRAVGVKAVNEIMAIIKK